MKITILTILSALLALTSFAGDGKHTAHYTSTAPSVDGQAEDSCWQSATWYPIEDLYLGLPFDSADFQGQFKVAWDENKLFLLVEIIDDTLVEFYEPWDTVWWDDDCVEIFIDEDNSDGNHQFNHNAFAYHVLQNGDVVDLGPDKKPHLYNQHITSKWVKKGNVYTWEFAITIYNDTYVDGKETNETVTLSANKKLGFMIAYCDNDHSKRRENFIGTIPIEGEDKDQGWIDAGVFGDLLLVKP